MPTGATNLPRRSLDTGVVYHEYVMDRHLTRERHVPLDPRFWEGGLSVTIFTLGSFILFNDQKIAMGSIFAVARELVGGVYGVGISTFAIGALGVSALIANGRNASTRRYGPWLRVLSATYRFMLWFSFAQSMARLTPSAQLWTSPM